MKTIKLTVSDDEFEEIKTWACGVPIAALIRRQVLLFIRGSGNPEGTQRVLSGYSAGTRDENSPGNSAGTQRVPGGYSAGTFASGTDLALKREEEEKKESGASSCRRNSRGGLEPIDLADWRPPPPPEISDEEAAEAERRYNELKAERERNG